MRSGPVENWETQHEAEGKWPSTYGGRSVRARVAKVKLVVEMSGLKLGSYVAEVANQVMIGWWAVCVFLVCVGLCLGGINPAYHELYFGSMSGGKQLQRSRGGNLCFQRLCRCIC